MLKEFVRAFVIGISVALLVWFFAPFVVQVFAQPGDVSAARYREVFRDKHMIWIAIIGTVVSFSIFQGRR